MTQKTALRTHETRQSPDSGIFSGLTESYQITDFQVYFTGIIIRHDHSRAAEDLDRHDGRFRQHHMVDYLGGIAESQTDAQMKSASGDTAVISRTAVDTCQTNPVTDHLRSIKFAVNGDPVTLSTGVFSGVDDQIVYAA